MSGRTVVVEPYVVNSSWRPADPTYVYSITDLGVTTWSNLSAVERADRAEILGEEFGYPQCCIDEFVDDVLDGRHPGMRRGSVPTEHGGRYVPCTACCEAIGRVIIP